jgi:surface polysaccharide O-acyltransferase-like enzyme
MFDGLVALAHWKAPTILNVLRRQPTPLIVLLATLLAFVPMSLLIPSFKWVSLGPFDVQPARIVLYFVYFLIGMALGTGQQWRGTVWPRHWGAWLALVVVSFVIYMRSSGDDTGQSSPLISQMLVSTAFALSCAGTSLGLLGAFRKLVRRSYPLLDNLSANAYGIYLIHYVVVIWIQFALLVTAWPAWIKFGMTAIGSLALSWGLSSLLRRIPAVRRIL